MQQPQPTPPEMELKQEADPDDHPDVKILPPIIYLGFLGLAAFFDMIMPTNIFGWGFQFAFGMLLACAGIALLTYCVMSFTRAGTAVPPTMPTTALVTDGVYAMTRNPIYVSFFLIYFGLCFLFDLLWGFLLAIPLFYVINRHVIEPEESYLEDKFGGTYLDYTEKVKRWF